MAKIRKYKLSWEASDSINITGYKIYWSKGESVGYDSKAIDVGNATEITLSDDITSSDSKVMFGVVAIDKNGNESDITTMSKPYYFNIPKSPAGLLLAPLDDFKIVEPTQSRSLTSKKADKDRPVKNEDHDPLADAIESYSESRQARMKYYDDVGYRSKP